MGGLQLLEYLKTVKAHLPVIVFTGHGDVPMVLQAMSSGAFAFIEKPATHQQILDCVQKALAFDQDRRCRDSERVNVEKRLTHLSPRELEVMDRLVAGMPNKKIAVDLAISERTLEKHRKNIMLKMGVGSLAELIRLIVLYEEHTAKSQ
jgi:FixJ family two-component response regulator